MNSEKVCEEFCLEKTDLCKMWVLLGNTFTRIENRPGWGREDGGLCGAVFRLFENSLSGGPGEQRTDDC